MRVVPTTVCIPVEVGYVTLLAREAFGELLGWKLFILMKLHHVDITINSVSRPSTFPRGEVGLNVLSFLSS